MNVEYYDAGCRVCNHIHFIAIDNFANPIAIEGCAAPRCHCSKDDFAPSDNLEYLEWCVENNANRK